MNRPPLWLLLLALVACRTAPAARPENAPTLLALELQIPSQGLTDFTVRAEGQVHCPEAATLERATFELVVEGKVVQSGELPLSAAVAPGGSAPFVLERTGRYVGSAAELKAMDARGGSLLIALRGKLWVKRGSTLDVLEYARSREVRVPRLPRIKLHDLDAARYAKDEANGTFYLGVFNPNPFPIKLSGVTYQLSIAGKRLAEGTLGEGESVDQAATGVFEVAFAATPASYGPGLERLIAGLSLPYVLEGELKGDLLSEPFKLEGKIQLNPTKK